MPPCAMDRFMASMMLLSAALRFSRQTYAAVYITTHSVSTLVCWREKPGFMAFISLLLISENYITAHDEMHICLLLKGRYDKIKQMILNRGGISP